MPEALKKALTKLEVNVGDLVLFKPPLGAPEDHYRPFVIAVAEELAQSGRGPVVVVQPGFAWDRLSDQALAEMGLIRLWRPGPNEASLEMLEEEAHQAVRIAFAIAQSKAERREESAERAADEMAHAVEGED